VTTGLTHVETGERFPVLGLSAVDYVYLEVADRGHGIPKEHLPRVMEPFFTTKAVQGGSGPGFSTL